MLGVLRYGHCKQGIETIPKRRRGTHCNKSVHIRRAMKHTAQAVDEEFLIYHHYDRRKHKLKDSDGNGIIIEKRRKREAPHHVPHRHVHQRRKKGKRRDQTLYKHGRFLIRQCIVIGSRGSLLIPLLFRAVARIDDGFDDRALARAALNAHRVCQEAHRARRDALNFKHSLLHPCRAGGTAHARYVILFHHLTSSISARSQRARRPFRPCPL